jgi:hypothetical protein
MSLIAGALAVAIVLLLLRKKAVSAPVTTIRSHTVAERVRSVGKLVGLEVHAKEIATSTKGWSWLPPIVLSQAKVAMIFHFEKQYFVDLSRLRASDVEMVENGTDAGSDRPKYRLRLPKVEGALRLTEVTPYDIQAGRIMGLIDVIQMDAPTQKELMKSAQDEAASLFHKAESRYVHSAQRSIESHLEALLHLVDVGVEVVWEDGGSAARAEVGEPISLGDTLARRIESAMVQDRR